MRRRNKCNTKCYNNRIFKKKLSSVKNNVNRHGLECRLCWSCDIRIADDTGRTIQRFKSIRIVEHINARWYRMCQQIHTGRSCYDAVLAKCMHIHMWNWVWSGKKLSKAMHSNKQTKKKPKKIGNGNKVTKILCMQMAICKIWNVSSNVCGYKSDHSSYGSWSCSAANDMSSPILNKVSLLWRTTSRTKEIMNNRNKTHASIINDLVHCVLMFHSWDDRVYSILL